MTNDICELVSTVQKALEHIKANPEARSYMTGDINDAVTAIAAQLGIVSPPQLNIEGDSNSSDFIEVEKWLVSMDEAISLRDYTYLYTDDNGNIAALVPIELIYTENKETARKKVMGATPEWLEHHLKYENIPLVKLTPHRDLFRFFIDGSIKPDRYMAWYKKIFTTRNMVPEYNDIVLLAKTQSEFIFMQEELSFNGLRFFIENPAQGDWNPRGYFNLLDGHHRASFLLEMGLRFIPVSMSDNSYRAWCNDEAAGEVRMTILGTRRNEFYTPILHPYFIKQNIIYRERFNRNRLFLIVDAMKNIRMKDKRVLDIGANLCYMGSHFYREGADVVCLEPDEYHYKLALALRNLCYGKYEIKKCFFENYQSDAPFDIGILLTVFYHYINKPQNRDEFIKGINENINSLIIWESGDNYEQEKEYIIANTKFKHFRHLSYTFGTGKIRELGMFMVDHGYLD